MLPASPAWTVNPIPMACTQGALGAAQDAAGRHGPAGQPGLDPAQKGDASAAPAGRRTREALSAADRIADALDLAAHETARLQVCAPHACPGDSLQRRLRVGCIAW